VWAQYVSVAFRWVPNNLRHKAITEQGDIVAMPMTLLVYHKQPPVKVTIDTSYTDKKHIQNCSEVLLCGRPIGATRWASGGA